MIEAKLRVERLEHRCEDNPFYGSVLVKKVVEDTHFYDKDERDDIAPYGVYATISTKNNAVFDIKVNRHYFDSDTTGGYTAYFTIQEKTYELWVRFEEDGKDIETLSLSEWVDSSSFENGDDADNIYRNSDFLVLETYL